MEIAEDNKGQQAYQQESHIPEPVLHTNPSLGLFCPKFL